jgi:hypothetical protein
MTRAPSLAAGTRSRAKPKTAAKSAAAVPARVQTTLRLEPELRNGLEVLQTALGTPLNKLVNMAVADFVAAKAAHVESELEAALKKIKALRRADPTFAKEFKAIAAAEIKHRKRDPVEGRAFREEPAKTPSAVSLVRRVVASAK